VSVEAQSRTNEVQITALQQTCLSIFFSSFFFSKVSITLKSVTGYLFVSSAAFVTFDLIGESGRHVLFPCISLYTIIVINFKSYQLIWLSAT